MGIIRFAHDPQWKALQHMNDLTGLIYFTSSAFEDKPSTRCRYINNPNRLLAVGIIHVLRREGDSNPRYGYPYGSLANCWFKPLTHRSIQLKARFLKEAFPPTGGWPKPLKHRSSCFSSGTKIYNRCILYKYLPFFSGRGPCRKKSRKTETFHPLIMIGENNFIIFEDANPTGYVESI